MEALKLFSKSAPNRTFLAIILGALSGLFYAALIPVVLKALSESNNLFVEDDKLVEFLGLEVAHSQYALLFLFLCLAILTFQSLSQIVLARIAIDIRFKLRKELYQRVQTSPIAALENVGSSKLIQALATDVSAIVAGAQLFPQLLTNSITLVGMLGYIAYLDIDVFIYIIEVITFGVIAYQIPVYFGTKYFSKAREHQDVLQEAFRGLIGGAKELKLSKDKRETYEEEVLHKQEKIVMGLEKKGLTIFTLVSNYGNLLSFFAIGGLSFIFINYSVISSSEIIAAVMVLLYVTGPISSLLNFIPQLSRTKISLKKIESLYHELPDENLSDDIYQVKPWDKLNLSDIAYKYTSGAKHSNAFGIGPVSLTISRGEVTFITGGNGSGKSTLAKVISLHYLPQQGQLFFSHADTEKKSVVDSQSMTAYRQEVSCIYSDYYLFDRILDVDSGSSDYQSQIDYYIKAFGLEGKVVVKDGRFSTTKLSDGQRRRLALVVSIIEDKPLLIFDEWAADQDPQFKTIFYHQILPYLKNKNKAVVVISHDDRYFDIADQLLVMESGQLVEQRRNNNTQTILQEQSLFA